MARDLGATGVPFFVFNQKVGLSGAQPVTAFVQAMEQAS
jgi:predicted DsbA family dithiol-disulfide isomerase